MTFRFGWPKLNPFVIGLIAMIALAFVYPEAGSRGGWLHPEVLTKLGVALVFFLQGGLTRPQALLEGARQWRLHLLIQTVTFVVFPMAGLSLLWLIGAHLGPDLGLGLFYLCALPSTVSSSVALTATAGGHAPLAMFNATTSNLLGVILTPLWMGVVLHATGAGIDVMAVMADLLIWLVLPMLAGQILRPLIGETLTTHRRLVGLIDRGTILLLVYASFCDSVTQHVWQSHGAGVVLVAMAVAGGLLVAALWGCLRLCQALSLPAAYRSAVVFCASQKSLAAGVPMAGLIFAGMPSLGLILLPILIYHPLQLLISASLAEHWAQEVAQSRNT